MCAPCEGVFKTAKDGRHSFSVGCSRSARQDVRAATRVPPVAHGAELQGGSRSAQRDQGRRPENRPEAHGDGQCENSLQRDHPQNWRATSLRPAGGRYTLNTVGEYALLWPFATKIPLATSSCMSLQYSTRLPTTSSFGSSHTSLVSLVPVSVLWFVQLDFSLHHLHSIVMSSACRIVLTSPVLVVTRLLTGSQLPSLARWLYPQEPSQVQSHVHCHCPYASLKSPPELPRRTSWRCVDVITAAAHMVGVIRRTCGRRRSFRPQPR